MLGEHATSLADGAAAYLDLKLDKTQQTSDWNAPHLTKQQIEYAAIDAVVAWRIAEKILPRFDVQRSAYEIQMGAVPAAMRMEQRGFKLDVERPRAADRGAGEGAPRGRTGISRGLPGGRPPRARRHSADNAGAEGGPARRPCLRATNWRAGAGRRSPGRSRPNAANCSAPPTIRRSWRW